MAKFGIGLRGIVQAFFKGETEEFTRRHYVRFLLIYWTCWALWLFGFFLLWKIGRGFSFASVAVIIFLILTTPDQLPCITYKQAKRLYVDRYQDEDDRERENVTPEVERDSDPK